MEGEGQNWGERMRDFLFVYKANILVWGSVVVMLVMGGFVGWLFLFNKGMLVIVSEAPYRVGVSGVGSYDCVDNRCSIEVAAGNYKVQVLKSGYEKSEFEAEVLRGKDNVREVELAYIPKVEVVGDFNGWTEGSLFGGEFNEEKAKDLFDAENFVWAEKKREIFFLDNNGETQRLVSVSIDSGEVETVVVFLRDIKKELLAISEDERKIVLVDQTNNSGQIYVVDLDSQSRERIGNKLNIRSIKWLGDDSVILNFLDENEDLIVGELNVISGEFLELPINARLRNIVVNDGKILFLEGLGSDNGSYLIFKTFDPESGEIKEFIRVEENLGGFPEKIELSSEGKVLRVLVDGRLSDIKLAL